MRNTVMTMAGILAALTASLMVSNSFYGMATFNALLAIGAFIRSK